MDIYDLTDRLRSSERVEVSCEGRGEPIVITWHRIERIEKTIVTQGDDPVVARAEERRRFTTRTRLTWWDLAPLTGKVWRVCEGCLQRMDALSGRERIAEFARMLRAAALTGHLLQMQTVAMPPRFQFEHAPSGKSHRRRDKKKIEKELREFGERWIADVIAGHKRTCAAYLVFYEKLRPHLEALSQ